LLFMWVSSQDTTIMVIRDWLVCMHCKGDRELTHEEMTRLIEKAQNNAICLWEKLWILWMGYDNSRSKCSDTPGPTQVLRTYRY
jgi:hypothetical protein